MAYSAAEFYEVRWREYGSAEAWSSPRRCSPVGEIVVEELDRTVDYEFQVRAVSACGAKSAWVSSAHTIPDAPTPPDIATLDATSVADGVALAWTVSGAPPAGIEYVVEWSGNGTVWVETTTVRALNYTYPVTSGTALYFRVRAVNYAGDYGAYSNVVQIAGKTVADGATVGATSGPGGNLGGEVDENHRPAIDFSQGIHVNPKLLYLKYGDGYTGEYYKPGEPGANVTETRVALQASNLTNHTQDNLADGTSYKRVGAGYVDSSSRVHRVFDSTLGSYREGNYLGTGAARATSAIDSSNIINSGSIDMSRPYTGKHIGNIPDDPASFRYAAGEAGAVSTRSADNALANPGFETGDLTGWALTIVGGASGAVDSSAGYSRTGTHNLRLVSSASSGDYVTAYPQTPGSGGGGLRIPVKPGDAATVSGWVTRTLGDAGAGLNIDFFDETGTNIEHNFYDIEFLMGITLSSTYQQFTGSVPAPAGAASYNIGLTARGNGTTSTAIHFDDIAAQGSKGLALTIQNSGVQLGDPRNLNPSVSANYAVNWSGQTISYSGSSASPKTISVSAATLNVSGVSISYGAMSVSVSGSGTVAYYLYIDDPTYSGGSHTLYATTSSDTLIGGTGRVYVGSCTVTFSTGTSGGGGSGCPSVDAFVLRAFLDDGRTDKSISAGSVKPGMYLRLRDGRAGLVTYAQPKMQPGVRVVGQSGHTLTCSESAPLGLLGHDDSVRAKDAEGSVIEWRCPVAALGEYIESVVPLGAIEVMHITCEDDFYWSGDDPSHLFSHHNMKPGP